jgi:hypothetical protein
MRAHLVSHPEIDGPNSSEWFFKLKQIGPGSDFLSYQNEHAVRDVIANVFDRWVPAEGAELRRILDGEISKQGLSQPKDKKISEHPWPSTPSRKRKGESGQQHQRIQHRRVS